MGGTVMNSPMQNIAHSQLEAAYHRAEKAINQIVGLLAAA
jgi:hypothetical protein